MKKFKHYSIEFAKIAAMAALTYVLLLIGALFGC